MSRLGLTVVAMVVIAAAVVTGYAIRLTSVPEEAPPETIATEEVAVRRVDLVHTETLSGTLGFAEQAQLRTSVSGTITWLPDETERLDRGDLAFEIDGLPVILMIGDRPTWRALVSGVADGADIEQLETNLIALGFGPDDWEPDHEFDDDTAAAVEAWREDVGLPEGDSVEYGRVASVPRPVRVGSVFVSVGQLVAAGVPVYATSTFDQEVVIDLDPDDVDLVDEGASVIVVLPDDREIAGEITEIGRVVVPSGPDPDAPGVLEVRVSLVEVVTDLDQAPVDVEVESSRAADVLAVPVRALVALSDGGYAVEVDGQLIGVETGDFADGLVEVRGALDEGDMATVPR